MADGPWEDLPVRPWLDNPDYEALSPNARAVYRALAIAGPGWLSWVVSDEAEALPGSSRWLPTPEQLVVALDELYEGDLLIVDDDGDICIGYYEEEV